MKSIHLHIDRIVVDGLPSNVGGEFAAALETQMREWAESGIADEFPAAARKRIAALSAGQLRPGASPRQAAARIVDALKESFGRRTSTKDPAPRNSASAGLPAKGWKHV